MPSNKPNKKSSSEKTNPKDCQIGVFYETHNDPIPSELLISLMPYFAHNRTIFLSEIAQDETKKQSIELMSKTSRILKKNPSLSPYATTLIKTYSAGITLFKQLKPLGIEYKAIDLPHAKRNACNSRGEESCLNERDDNFIKQIKNICAKYETVIFLVGYGHHEVIMQLKNDGYRATGFAPLHNFEEQRRLVLDEAFLKQKYENNPQILESILGNGPDFKPIFNHPELFIGLEGADLKKCAEVVMQHFKLPTSEPLAGDVVSQEASDAEL